MTAAELRTILAAMLADLLGDYTTKSGATLAAIYVGDPPSDYTVSGLECRIPIVPTVTNNSAYARGFVGEVFTVRLVSHGAPSNQLAALRKIASRWADAQIAEVPANETLGILSQHTISIPA